jgi:hypothetical protein
MIVISSRDTLESSHWCGVDVIEHGDCCQERAIFKSITAKCAAMTE